ncbi:PHP domain-containing protein [Candidatus Poribacteria bacterium]|nr:PHP domain-containing protein [Candidatus Poribacteria bacterium]
MPDSLFGNFPDIDKLLEKLLNNPYRSSEFTNLHIHTPFSFSAFSSVSEAVKLAYEQNIKILGISDFNTTKGYKEFTNHCLKRRIFPVCCMETIALSIEDQKQNIRWNDPSNPGRIYFSGKGLKYPLEISPETSQRLERLSEAMGNRTHKMLNKLNEHLKQVLPDIKLDYEYIRDNMTKGTVRERHLAKALQQSLYDKFSDTKQLKEAIAKLYDTSGKADVNDKVSIQNELRSNLLKAGKVAFVEEKPESYLSMEEAKNLMLDMGGIPCYPVLADDSKGELNEAEKTPDYLCDQLLDKGIYCVEFIPTRNRIELLKDYVSVFRDNGIIMVAGTEHNTPKMESMVPMCKGDVPMDEELKEIFWKGACIIAGHQFLISINEDGFVDNNGERTIKDNSQLESLGEAVVSYYMENTKE